jgi:hypothetical protein
LIDKTSTFKCFEEETNLGKVLAQNSNNYLFYVINATRMNELATRQKQK